MEGKEKRQYFLRYTALFALMTIAAYFLVLIQGKTLISKFDAFNQHYRALMYYGQWLRKIVKALLFEHRLIFPEWDFSIGYGSNVLTTLHYYAIGDPLDLLSVFVPTRYTLYLFCFLTVFRMYLAGLAFSWLCGYFGYKNQTALLAGAFTYAFCGYAIFVSTRHQFFLNPMIYFPLIVLGAEKVIRRERPYLLIGAVCVAEMSNFYFFYMIVLLTVVYVLVRVCLLYGVHRGKELLSAVARVGFYSLVGALLGMILFLPVILQFLQDSRGSAGNNIHVFYRNGYYKAILMGYTGMKYPGLYTCLGYGAAGLLSAGFLFLQRKKKKTEKILWIIATAFLILPAAGYILNGFSYTSNRWVWAYSLLTAFLLTEQWEEMFCMAKWQIAVLCGISAVYLLICGEDKGVLGVGAVLIAMFLVLIYANTKKKDKRLYGTRAAETALLVLVFAGIVWNATYDLSESGNRRSVPLLGPRSINANTNKNPDRQIKELMETDSGFWRYTGKGLQRNSSINSGTRNTQYYWSISNRNISAFLEQTELLCEHLYLFTDLDDRTVLSSLLDAKYYVSQNGEENAEQYGSTYIKEENGWKIYENKTALPLAFTYDSYITEDVVEELNGLQKEEVMAQSVILEENPAEGTLKTTGEDLATTPSKGTEKEDTAENASDGAEGDEASIETVQGNGAEGLHEGTPILYEKTLPASLIAGDGTEVSENSIRVTAEDAAVTLETNGGAEEEIYLRLAGYSYQGKGKTSLVVSCEYKDGTKVQKTLNYYPKGDVHATQQKDFLLNLGFGKSDIETVTLNFSKKGTYTYDEISVYALPMEEMEECLQERGADAWEDEQIGVDRVSGKISVGKEKLLFLSIPYDGGWSVSVDGEKQEVLKANYGFSTVQLTAGEHEVVFTYRTPGIRLGAVLSLLGVVALVGVVVRERRSCKL